MARRDEFHELVANLQKQVNVLESDNRILSENLTSSRRDGAVARKKYTELESIVKYQTTMIDELLRRIRLSSEAFSHVMNMRLPEMTPAVSSFVRARNNDPESEF